MQTIQEVLINNIPKELKALFSFGNESDDLVLIKFQLWSRKYFPKYFSSDDAPFHKEIDQANLSWYKGDLEAFVDIAFRGAAKTARTKLFLAYAIANDKFHRRKYIKILSEDSTNSKQIVTDVYNMLNNPDVVPVYSEIFEKTTHKREETMSSFTTATGIKVIADTVGTDQRGAIQEESRPDLIWFEDFENRVTLRSAVKTKAIWDNMEEARTGLAKGGSCLYTCNYISERGNVHTLVIKPAPKKKVLIIPIMNEYGIPTWNRYSVADIEQMKIQDDDFEGERMCRPSASKDIIFDRQMVDDMPKLIPIQEIAGLRIYKRYDASHRYASAQDVAGGVGLDSSTDVIIDFDTIPAQVVATYDNNEIKPDIFGDEIVRHAERFGECLVAPERNNHGHATIGRLKQIYPNDKIFKTQKKESSVKIPGKNQMLNEYGWNTNMVTKPKMLLDLAKAVDNGYLALNCPKLIAEVRSYTRNDLMDAEVDVRLTTRHFDILMAAAICWQMRNFVDFSEKALKNMDAAQRILDESDYDQFDVLPG